MHKIKLTMALMLFIGSFLAAQQADDIIGNYHLPNNLDIKIFKVEGKYQGEIIALNGYENGETKDFKNPDKSKRNDPLLGKIIIHDLEFDKKNKKWINGSMYGAKKGIMLNLKVTKMSKKEITVVGSKYFFWKTLTWEKI